MIPTRISIKRICYILLLLLVGGGVASAQTYTLSGSVTGDTQEGVLIEVEEVGGDYTGETTSDTDGSYSISGIPHEADITVTPSKDGYSFTPSSQDFSNVTNNIIQDFEASIETYTLSGSVTGDTQGGVLIEVGGDYTGETTTGTNGSYSISDIPHDSDITVTPSKEGYSFDPSSQNFDNVTNDISEDFVANIETYNLTVETDGTSGAATDPSGTVSVDHGVSREIQVTSIPDGYSFTGWTVVSGSANIDEPSQTTTNVTLTDGDATVQANFSIDEYQLTVQTDGTPGAATDPSGTVSVEHGVSREIQVTSIPDGYSFTGWTVVSGSANIDEPSQTTTDVTLTDGDATVQANFSIDEYQLTVETDGTPGAATDPSGTVSVEHGESREIQVTSIPDGYSFTGWTVVSGSANIDEPSQTTTNVTLTDGDATVQANFNPITYTITASSGDNGSIDPSGDVTVVHGDDQSFTITPDTNYEIEDVTVDGSSVLNNVNFDNGVGTYTFENVQSDHSIHATFIILPPPPPALSSPENNEDEVQFDVNLSWVEADRANTYNLQVATTSDFQEESRIVDATNMDETSYSLENLDSGTQYYWRVSASNLGGTSDWSEVWNFTTIKLPDVSTNPTANRRDISATLNGVINDLGQPPLTEYGFVWGTSPVPDLNDNVENLGSTSSTGPFSEDISGLQPGTTYYVRAYAINEGNTVYGNEVPFTTTTPANLVFIQQPEDTQAGQTLPDIIVEVRDENDNITTSFDDQVSINIEDGPDNASLSGTTTQTAFDGVVTFENLVINTAGEDYTLGVSAAGLTDAISDAFSILAADPAVIEQISGDGQEGLINTELDEQFVIRVLDEFDNPVNGVTVDFEITGTPSGATGQSLSDEVAVTNSLGESSTLLTIGNRSGTYTVTAELSAVGDVGFSATVGTVEISGEVTEAGEGLADVTVAATWDGFSQSTDTDLDGTYIIMGIPRGAIEINITPSKEGFHFEPENTVIIGPVVGDISNVNFITTPPFAPELDAPQDNAVDLPASITVEWSETERADYYGLQVSETENFSSGIIVDETGIETTSYEIDDLEHGETYFWRVNAVNPSGTGNWSEVWSFAIVPTTTHLISLQPGWNMVSSYIEPLDDSASDIFGDLDNLILAKNGDGDIYGFDIDDIEEWNYAEGYQIYLHPDSDILEIYGIELNPESTTIELQPGWNLTGYTRNSEMHVVEALETIEDNLIIAKNGAGQVYIPAGVVGEDMIITIEDEAMKPGEGYQVFASESSELIYPSNDTETRQHTAQEDVRERSQINTAAQPIQYVIDKKTGSNAILIIESEDLQEGDEISVWTENDILAGSGVAQANGKAVITVWGDDELNEDSINGALNGESLTLKGWLSGIERETEIAVVNVKDIINNKDLGENLSYNRDDVLHITVDINDEIPDDFMLAQNYPNPFNPYTTIQYGIPENTHVVLEVYNVLGQKVKTLVHEEQQAGIYEVVLDGSGHASGTYFYRLQAGDFVEVKKLILLK